MKFAVLDFETYFDEEYTLKKMTTEAYIRDPRYLTHCVGVKSMDKLPFAAEIAQPTMTANHEGFNKLKSKVSDYALVCHNAAFDGLILSHHYGVRPAFWFDTLSMARLVFPHDRSHSLESLADKFRLPAKSVPYNRFRGVRDILQVPGLYDELARGCAHDVELTYIIFRYLLPLVPREELKIIDWTVRAFTEPVLRLDRPKTEIYLEKVRTEKAAVLDQLGVTKADLHSSARFAALLSELGVQPPVKPSPKNPDKVIFAFAKTDDGMKELLEDEDPRVVALAAARLGVKSTINETRCERLLEMDGRGALCVFLKAFGAHTLRFAGGDQMNWQNFPRAGEIRGCIMAPTGYVIAVADQSQIECRLLNWLAGEQWVLDAFREGRDIYSENATKFYQRPIIKSDKLERHLGKTIELGCGYGMGAPKFQITCKRGALGGPSITLDNNQSKQAIDLYRTTHPRVVELWTTGSNILSHLFNGTEILWGPLLVKDKKIYGPGGSWLDYSHLIYDGAGKYGRPDFSVLGRKGKTRIYGAKLIENVIQWLSGVVIRQAMLEIGARYRLVLQVHDEILALAPAAEGPQCLEYMLKVLKTPPAWCPDIPLDAEGSFNVRYCKA